MLHELMESLVVEMKFVWLLEMKFVLEDSDVCADPVKHVIQQLIDVNQ